MAERRERRTVARVALSGTQIVRTHEGLAAHLLDLSLQGARIAHFGTLRPGTLCFIQLPAEAGALALPVRVLWCVIYGAEWRSDGERHLRSHSGLGFTALTAPQQTILVKYLQEVRTGDPASRDREPGPSDPILDPLHLIRCPTGNATRVTGTNGHNGSGAAAGAGAAPRGSAGV